MGAAGGAGLCLSVCGWRGRVRASCAGGGTRPVARVTAPFLGSPSSARITFLARAQGIDGMTFLTARFLI